MKILTSGATKSITGAAIILGAASFISRVIGVVRDRIFASQFGAGDMLDAYYAAFRVPDLVYNLLIVGALSAGFIPIFMELLVKDKKEAWKITNAIINILGISLILICSILIIYTPFIINHIVPGFNSTQIQTTVLLTRIMFLSPILLGLSSVISGVLQSFKSFFVYSMTPIMYNLGIIFGAIFFVPKLGISGLAWGVILGACMHLGIQLPTLMKHGFSYKFIFLWGNPYLKKIFSLMIPRTLSLATAQLNLIAMTFIASLIGSGSIAILNLANNLQYFPIGIIGISFAVAAFPSLAHAISEKKENEFIQQLSTTIRQILFFIIPLSILFLLLRAQIVRIILGSGHFDWNDTILTSNTLAFFSLSFFAQSLIPIFARAFYALQNTWLPLISGIIGFVSNIIIAWYLKDILGVAGLAIAFSISSIIQLTTLWILLRTKIKTIFEIQIIVGLLKISVGALAMTALTQWIKTPISSFVDMTRFWGIFLQGTIAGTAGLSAYCVICYLLRVEEMILFISSLKKRWLKLTNIQGELRKADEI